MNTTGALRGWRLLVAASAGTGVWLASREYDVWWTALSQLANLAVAVTYAALAALGPRVSRPAGRWWAGRWLVGRSWGGPWLRGALATVMVLVSLAYLPMANGNLAHAWSILEHVVTPLLVVLDVAVVARLSGVRWWHPLTWTLAPAAYLAWYVAADLRVYAALDPAHPVALALRAGALLALLLAAGHGLRLVAGWSHELAPADARPPAAA